MIKAYFYDGAGRDREMALKGSLPKMTRQQLVWIDITGRSPRDLKKVGKLLKISSRCVADLAEHDSDFRLNTYSGYLHFDVASLKVEEIEKLEASDEPSSLRLDFVVGKQWLITVHDEPLKFLSEFRDQDRGETLIGKLTPAGLSSALLDWHLSPYLAASEALEAICDDVDDQIVAERSIQSKLLPSIVAGKHYISDLRRLLVPQRSVFYGLSRADVALITGEASGEHFKSLEHRFERALDVIEHGREVVQSSFDLYSARIGEKTNVLIRRLTFISILLGAVGAVAGVFGMNFETPYTQSGLLGFWLVIGSLLTFALAFTAISLWRKWI